MVKINVFRTSEILQGEQKWLAQQLDARLGLSLGVDVAFVTSPSDALRAEVVVALGGAARAILMNVTPTSDPSARGSLESYADRTVITTWNIADAIKDVATTKEFLVDMLRARVYAYGLGNRATGGVQSVTVGGEGNPKEFTIDQFEEFVSAYEIALGAK